MSEARDELREQCAQMLNAAMEVPPGTRTQLRRMGFAEDDINLKALILANIGKLAIGKNARIAVDAAQMLFEICGDGQKRQGCKASTQLHVPDIFKRYYPRYKAGEIDVNDFAIICGMRLDELIHLIQQTECGGEGAVMEQNDRRWSHDQRADQL